MLVFSPTYGMPWKLLIDKQSTIRMNCKITRLAIADEFNNAGIKSWHTVQK